MPFILGLSVFSLSAIFASFNSIIFHHKFFWGEENFQHVTCANGPILCISILANHSPGLRIWIGYGLLISKCSWILKVINLIEEKKLLTTTWLQSLNHRTIRQFTLTRKYTLQRLTLFIAFRRWSPLLLTPMNTAGEFLEVLSAEVCLRSADPKKNADP